MTLPNDLITPREAARLVRAHVSTVYRWIHGGELAAYRRGPNRFLVSKEDVEKMVSRVVPEMTPAQALSSAEEERRYQEVMQRLREKGLKV